MNHPPSFDLQCQDKQLRRAAIWDIILEVPTGMPVKSLRNEILMAGCSDEVLLSNSSADILDERRPWNNKILVLPTVPKMSQNLGSEKNRTLPFLIKMDPVLAGLDPKSLRFASHCGSATLVTYQRAP